MKSVFLSAGHSDTDPGAVANGRREADIAVAFRNMVAFYLQRAGVPHELDGTGTTNLPLAIAAVRARYHPIGVEFHCNAAALPSATGVETLSGPKDMVLGGRICAALSGALGIRNRGAKPESAGQHHRLAFVRAGGIIVELFFLTNPRDLAAYDARCWVAARDVAQVLIEAAEAP
ncbi:MAG TPA: N-acetylmuramoyl-L-alanine amidase [Rhodocyclaceae bacterium]|nr:N-acetylmuramoyl-L-alanine amidase [Rhodocyclaceae bacterium]